MRTVHCRSRSRRSAWGLDTPRSDPGATSPTCQPAARLNFSVGLRHLVTRVTCHRHGSRPVGMAELAMRADLSFEAPAVSLQGTDDVSHRHELKLGGPCDDLPEPSRSPALCEAAIAVSLRLELALRGGRVRCGDRGVRQVAWWRSAAWWSAELRCPSRRCSFGSGGRDPDGVEGDSAVHAVAGRADRHGHLDSRGHLTDRPVTTPAPVHSHRPELQAAGPTDTARAPPHAPTMGARPDAARPGGYPSDHAHPLRPVGRVDRSSRSERGLAQLPQTSTRPESRSGALPSR
jgi:hypothetical protein